jgi:hypothetical protein
MILFISYINQLLKGLGKFAYILHSRPPTIKFFFDAFFMRFRFSDSGETFSEIFRSSPSFKNADTLYDQLLGNRRFAFGDIADDMEMVIHYAICMELYAGECRDTMQDADNGRFDTPVIEQKRFGVGA